MIAASRSALRERLTRQQINDPAWDRWDRWDQRLWITGAWQTGGNSRRLTFQAGYVESRGEGALASDTTGLVFAAGESVLRGEAELRFLPASAQGVTAAFSLDLTRESRTRSDSIAHIQTVVTAFTPSLAISLGKPLGNRGLAALGAGYAHYGPTSTLPTPGSLNSVYRSFVVPEYAVYGTRAGILSLSGLVRYQISASAALWIGGRFEHLGPTDQAVAPYTRPPGARSTLGLVTGITVGPMGQP